MVAVLFQLLLTFALVFVIYWGDTITRRFTALLLLVAVATPILHWEIGWLAARPFIFLADIVLLVAALRLVAVSHQFWPIWFAAFQALTVSTDFAQYVFPNSVPAIYVMAADFWSLPALGVMVLGTFLDHRAESGTAA